MMRCRKFNLMAWAAALLTISFFAADLHAGKNPKAKSKEATAASATTWPQIPDLEFTTRLRQEEYDYSQVMELMSHLTDNIGARLTGSPDMKKANEWTRDEFIKWGLVNAHQEPWGPFGRGWAYQLCEVRMISPDYMQFLALPEAWTPGTDGPLRAEVVRVKASAAADLEKYRGKLAGKIVLFGDNRKPEPEDKPLFNRATEAELEKTAQYEPGGPPNQRNQDAVKRYQFRADSIKFFTDEKVAAVLDITREPGENGDIQVQAGGPYEKGKTISFPRITLSLEHFGRLARLLERNVPVEVELNVETRFYDDDPMGYNTIAEIPGVDPKLKDQVVMLGGHLDSWHSSEGATDNGAGAIVSMEVVQAAGKAGRAAAPDHPHRAVVRRRTGDAGLKGLRLGALWIAPTVDRSARPDSARVDAPDAGSAALEAGAEAGFRLLQPRQWSGQNSGRVPPGKRRRAPDL